MNLTISIFPLLHLNAQVPAEEFGITPTCSENEIQPFKEGEDKFIIYGNESLGYKIEYPKDWKVIQTHCLLEGMGVIYTSSIVNFVSTPNSDKNGLLGITVSDYSVGHSIDEFAKVYTKDFGNMIESTKIIMLDDKPSAKFTINAGNDSKLSQITILANDKRFDITHPISNIISNSTIQYMIDSFKIFHKDTINSDDLTEEDELG
ncbi:MAG TPA: hypothetical protein VFV86_00915 [Nitrososphaeraceae archaeon]|nr:hypothetical protein [Nitrososphaeraceae archaeon]